MGFYFFPRGGGAQVARYLCRALAGGPWDPFLFAGSLGTASEYSNADRFFRGVRCQSLDYTPAADRWADGDDPMSAAVPMHASYEDKPGGPDRIFVDLDEAATVCSAMSCVQLWTCRASAASSRSTKIRSGTPGLSSYEACIGTAADIGSSPSAHRTAAGV